MKAEVIWAMKIVMFHSSYNSYKDAAKIFQLMFSDTDIAKKITLCSSKMAYVVAYGLSPYFYKELLEDIGKNTKFVLCLDEALKSLKGQMNLIVRYSPENCNEVKVRFLNSVFFGHSTAQNLYEKFLEDSSDLDLSNLLQISIDVPNVNLKFLKTFQDEIKENKGHLI